MKKLVIFSIALLFVLPTMGMERRDADRLVALSVADAGARAQAAKPATAASHPPYFRVDKSNFLIKERSELLNSQAGRLLRSSVAGRSASNRDRLVSRQDVDSYVNAMVFQATMQSVLRTQYVREVLPPDLSSHQQDVKRQVRAHPNITNDFEEYVSEVTIPGRAQRRTRAMFSQHESQRKQAHNDFSSQDVKDEHARFLVREKTARHLLFASTRDSILPDGQRDTLISPSDADIVMRKHEHGMPSLAQKSLGALGVLIGSKSGDFLSRSSNSNVSYDQKTGIFVCQEVAYSTHEFLENVESIFTRLFKAGDKKDLECAQQIFAEILNEKVIKNPLCDTVRGEKLLAIYKANSERFLNADIISNILKTAEKHGICSVLKNAHTIRKLLPAYDRDDLLKGLIQKENCDLNIYELANRLFCEDFKQTFSDIDELSQSLAALDEWRQAHSMQSEMSAELCELDYETKNAIQGMIDHAEKFRSRWYDLLQEGFIRAEQLDVQMARDGKSFGGLKPENIFLVANRIKIDLEYVLDNKIYRLYDPEACNVINTLFDICQNQLYICDYDPNAAKMRELSDLAQKFLANPIEGKIELFSWLEQAVSDGCLDQSKYEEFQRSLRAFQNGANIVERWGNGDFVIIDGISLEGPSKYRNIVYYADSQTLFDASQEDIDALVSRAKVVVESNAESCKVDSVREANVNLLRQSAQYVREHPNNPVAIMSFLRTVDLIQESSLLANTANINQAHQLIHDGGDWLSDVGDFLKGAARGFSHEVIGGLIGAMKHGGLQMAKTALARVGYDALAAHLSLLEVGASLYFTIKSPANSYKSWQALKQAYHEGNIEEVGASAVALISDIWQLKSLAKVKDQVGELLKRYSTVDRLKNPWLVQQLHDQQSQSGGRAKNRAKEKVGQSDKQPKQSELSKKAKGKFQKKQGAVEQQIRPEQGVVPSKVSHQHDQRRTADKRPAIGHKEKARSQLDEDKSSVAIDCKSLFEPKLTALCKRKCFSRKEEEILSNALQWKNKAENADTNFCDFDQELFLDRANELADRISFLKMRDSDNWKELIKDPAHKGNVTRSSIEEACVAVAAKLFKFGKKFSRHEEAKIDLVDETGKLWEVKALKQHGFHTRHNVYESCKEGLLNMLPKELIKADNQVRVGDKEYKNGFGLFLDISEADDVQVDEVVRGLYKAADSRVRSLLKEVILIDYQQKDRSMTFEEYYRKTNGV